jgi:hypothetical protein
MQSPKKYRPLHWEDHTDINHNLNLIKNIFEDKPEYKRQPSEFLELAKKLSNFKNEIDIEVKFIYDEIPLPEKEVNVIIFAFENEYRKEIFRPDIYDKGIIDQTSNIIHFNIPRLIHEKIDHAIWMYKYTDDTFSERLELALSKKNNKYYIV